MFYINAGKGIWHSRLGKRLTNRPTDFIKGLFFQTQFKPASGNSDQPWVHLCLLKNVEHTRKCTRKTAAHAVARFKHAYSVHEETLCSNREQEAVEITTVNKPACVRTNSIRLPFLQAELWPPLLRGVLCCSCYSTFYCRAYLITGCHWEHNTLFLLKILNWPKSSPYNKTGDKRKRRVTSLCIIISNISVITHEMLEITHGWQSLTRSWSVVPGWRPRMYRFVLLSCSPTPLLLLLLLLVLGLGGAIWWPEDT